MRRYTRALTSPSGAAIFTLSHFVTNVPRSPAAWACAALNTFLGRQPAAQNMLAAHAGRTFHLRMGSLPVALTIGHDGTLSPADMRIVPDVELRVDMGLLLRSGWMPGNDMPDMPGLVHVTGDAAMAQSLSVLARHWRPDLEDILSDWVGDVAAVQLVQGTRALFRGVLTAAGKLTENVAEFLAYESRDLTPTPVMRSMRDQLQGHQQTLMDVSQSVANLSARLQVLERHRSAPGNAGALNKVQP